jgi:hypothetical protein
LGHKARRGAYVDWVHVAFVIVAHVAIRKETIGEEGEEHEFWERKKLVA